jgi:hypothetical protein
MEQELGTTHDGREQGLTRSRRHARRLKKPTKPAEQSNSGRSIGIRDFFGPHKFMGPVRSNRWHMLRPGPAARRARLRVPISHAAALHCALLAELALSSDSTFLRACLYVRAVLLLRVAVFTPSSP